MTVPSIPVSAFTVHRATSPSCPADRARTGLGNHPQIIEHTASTGGGDCAYAGAAPRPATATTAVETATAATRLDQFSILPSF